MNRLSICRALGAALLLCTASVSLHAYEDFDPQQLEAQARPAVVLLIVADAQGKPFCIGTGFFVSADGKIVTNRHVIEGAGKVVAKTENGTVYPVTGVLGIHPKADLALLQSVAQNAPYLEVAQASFTPLESHVLVIGNPQGKEGIVSEGLLTKVGDWHVGEKMVTTAAVSPGSSGSPVLNAHGEVIGVIVEEELGKDSISYAIPGELPREMIAEFGEGSGAPVKNFSEIEWGDAYKVRLDADYGTALNAIGDQDFEKAYKLLTGVTRRFPKNAEAWERLGSVCDALKRYDECQTAFITASQLDPYDGDTWFNLAHSYFMNKHVDEGIAASTKALEYEPDLYEARVNLAIGYAEKQQFSEAEEQLQKAIRINPDDATAWRSLGQVQLNQKKLPDAADALEKAANINPNDVEVWQILVALEPQVNRPDRLWDAQQHLKQLSGEQK